METIIQQIAKKLINKILEKAYSGGISDIDALSSAVLGDCKEAAVEMIEEITVQLNRQIRNDKRPVSYTHLLPLTITWEDRLPTDVSVCRRATRRSSMILREIRTRKL